MFAIQYVEISRVEVFKNQNPSFWQKFQTIENRSLNQFLRMLLLAKCQCLTLNKTHFDSSKPAVNHRKTYQTIDKNQNTEHYYFN